MRGKIILKTIISIIVVSLIVWAISCAVNPVTGKREFMLLTENDELALGQQTDQQVMETYGIYDDPELLNYVTTIGTKMGKLTHRPALNYSFKILDTPVINAFAVPGGYVYFTRGILAYLNNEAELAGVMAHELGHINARHSAVQYSRATLAQLGLGVGAMVSETFRKYAGLAQFGVGMLFLRFSRDNERQADALGVEYSSKSGYDSNNMANFFVTLERLYPSEDQSGLPGWFSTHPNPPDRIAAIKKDTQKWQGQLQIQQYAVNRDNFLTQVDGINFGEDPRQGYVEGNTFYHPELRIQFAVPSGWKLNNTPSQVQMFTQQQDAVMLFSMAKEASPSAAASSFVTNSNAVVKSSDPIQVNGMSAQRVISDLTTEQGVISISSYFIQKDNKIYVFHGYTGQAQFNNYLPSFNQTMGQFKNLTDPAKINVKPDRLVIKKTQRQGTLRSALQQFGVAQDKLEETAIMNGMNLDDNVAANTLIKVVVR
jgi:predicted Zn-dependent protease